MYNNTRDRIIENIYFIFISSYHSSKINIILNVYNVYYSIYILY